MCGMMPIPKRTEEIQIGIFDELMLFLLQIQTRMIVTLNAGPSRQRTSCIMCLVGSSVCFQTLKVLKDAFVAVMYL